MTNQRRLRIARVAGWIVLSIGAVSVMAQDMTAGTGQRHDSSTSDRAIEARLITAYSLNKHLNATDIAVHAQNGVVTVIGRVDRERDRGLAVRLAQELPGVSSVRDRLEVEASPAVTPKQKPAFTP